MPKRINQERCIQCGVCIEECPNAGIAEVEGEVRIETGLCTDCFGFYKTSRCAELCPVEAVETDSEQAEDEDIMVGRSADLHPDRFPRG